MKEIEYYSQNKNTSHDWGYNGPGYYFWDETWRYAHGPYKSGTSARIQLYRYCIKESLPVYWKETSPSGAVDKDIEDHHDPDHPFRLELGGEG